MTTILILTAICLQAIFGGIRGNVGFCLGGGHDHTADEVVTDCDLACDHHTGFHAPLPFDNSNHENCPCTDVEFEITDLLISLRNVHRQIEPITLPPTAVLVIEDLVPPASWRGPPHDSPDNPSSAQRLAVVRTTKLII